MARLPGHAPDLRDGGAARVVCLEGAGRACRGGDGGRARHRPDAHVHHLRRDPAAEHSPRKRRAGCHPARFHGHHAGPPGAGDPGGVVFRGLHRGRRRFRHPGGRVRAAAGRAGISRHGRRGVRDDHSKHAGLLRRRRHPHPHRREQGPLRRRSRRALRRTGGTRGVVGFSRRDRPEGRHAPFRGRDLHSPFRGVRPDAILRQKPFHRRGARAVALRAVRRVCDDGSLPRGGAIPRPGVSLAARRSHRPRDCRFRRKARFSAATPGRKLGFRAERNLAGRMERTLRDRNRGSGRRPFPLPGPRMVALSAGGRDAGGHEGEMAAAGCLAEVCHPRNTEPVRDRHFTEN